MHDEYVSWLERKRGAEGMLHVENSCNTHDVLTNELITVASGSLMWTHIHFYSSRGLEEQPSELSALHLPAVEKSSDRQKSCMKSPRDYDPGPSVWVPGSAGFCRPRVQILREKLFRSNQYLLTLISARKNLSMQLRWVESDGNTSLVSRFTCSVHESLRPVK